jgi:hypothetical protein
VANGGNAQYGPPQIQRTCSLFELHRLRIRALRIEIGNILLAKTTHRVYRTM